MRWGRASVLAPLALLGACGAQAGDGPRYRVDKGSGVALVYREGDSGLTVGNAASAGGVFELRGDCLIVEVAGKSSIPVFPVAARYDAARRAVAMGGRSYALGRPWRLEFASEGDGTPEGLANPSDLPASCPHSFFHFGGIAPRADN